MNKCQVKHRSYALRKRGTPLVTSVRAPVLCHVRRRLPGRRPPGAADPVRPGRSGPRGRRPGWLRRDPGRRGHGPPRRPPAADPRPAPPRPPRPPRAARAPRPPPPPPHPRPALPRTRAQIGNRAVIIDAGAPPTLEFVLKDLAERAVARLLVEGGAQLLAEFLARELPDE